MREERGEGVGKVVDCLIEIVFFLSFIFVLL